MSRDSLVRAAARAALLLSVAAMGLVLSAACVRGGSPEIAAPPTLEPAMVELTAVASGAPGETGRIEEPVTDAGGPLAEMRATQDAASADLGIAEVSELVKRQQPLATFTPDSRGPRVAGQVVYLRSGTFYSAQANGNDLSPLRPEREMPAAWSPPDDPGRAWVSPDGSWIAFFAGSDAAMWLIQANGRDNHAVSGNNLPDLKHTLTTADGQSQTLRLRPGLDYTVVRTPGADEPFVLLVDDNSRHIKGEARMRVVHVAAVEKDRPLSIWVNGQSEGPPISFGRATAELRVLAGSVQLDAKDETGRQVAGLPAFQVSERELVTVFLHGDGALKGSWATYEPGTEPQSGTSRLRVFNAGSVALDAAIDGPLTVASGLPPGEIGPYAAVPAVAGEDEVRDFQQIIYGLRSGEEPVAWSPDGAQVAFVGAPDGQVDLFVSDRKGPARRVTHDERFDLNPVWSPGGRNLAWLSPEAQYELHHLMYLLEGGEPQELDVTPLRAAAGWSDTAPVAFPSGVDWLADDRLALYPSSARVSAGIWTFDVRTGDLEAAYGEPVTDPDWSATAGAWVFDRPEGGVFVLRPGGEASAVAPSGGFPRWSPDGRRISYVEGAPTSPDGWRLHVVDADGSNDRALTDWLPLLQTEPPVPGPNAKRYWLGDGRFLAFTRAGTDYGRAEEAGALNVPRAGDDIENLWLVAVDGQSPPRQVTDLTRIFYLRDVTESTDGSTLGLTAFSYLDRTQQLWTVAADGGKPVHVDGAVRWFAWLSK